MQVAERSSLQALHSSNVALHNNTVALLKHKFDLRPKKDAKSRSTAELPDGGAASNVNPAPSAAAAHQVRHVASLPSIGCGDCWARQYEVERLRRELAALKLSLRLALDAAAAAASSPVDSDEPTGLCCRCGQACTPDEWYEKPRGSVSSAPSPRSWPSDYSGEICDKYGQLYSQSRRKALAALNAFASLDEVPKLKEKLLLSIIVLAYRKCRLRVRRIKEKVGSALNLSHSSNGDADPRAYKFTAALTAYLVDGVDRLDAQAVTKEVSDQVNSTLFDYPYLATCDELSKYTKECVDFAWMLSVRRPDCDLVVDASKVQQQQLRMCSLGSEASADGEPPSGTFPLFWPAIIDSKTGSCIHEGYDR